MVLGPGSSKKERLPPDGTSFLREPGSPAHEKSPSPHVSKRTITEHCPERMVAYGDASTMRVDTMHQESGTFFAFFVGRD